MVDAKNRFDVRLSKAYRHADGDLELVLNVQNLFDDPYWEFAATSARAPEVGNLSERRIYAELRYTLR
jgi:hypothetical protein